MSQIVATSSESDEGWSAMMGRVWPTMDVQDATEDSADSRYSASGSWASKFSGTTTLVLSLSTVVVAFPPPLLVEVSDNDCSKAADDVVVVEFMLLLFLEGVADDEFESSCLLPSVFFPVRILQSCLTKFVRAKFS